jgi:hypothetical protein
MTHRWQQLADNMRKKAATDELASQSPNFWLGYSEGLERAIKDFREGMRDETPLTIADSWAAVAQARFLNLVSMFSHLNPPYPRKGLDGRTQVKVCGAVLLMMQVGRLPGDVPVEQRIEFRKMPEKVVDWLESKCRIPARRDFAPLGGDYLALFDCGDRLPDASLRKTEFFYGYLTDILLKEAQILTAIQYFEASGLRRPRIPDEIWRKVMTEEQIREIKPSHSGAPDLMQLHGLLFVDYCAFTIRSQWDKMNRLVATAFDLKDDWASFENALDVIGDLKQSWQTPPGFLDIYRSIATERLVSEPSWLRRYRDALAHKISMHPMGILPQAKSDETATELWDRVLDEHTWYREAFLALIGLIITARPLHE